MAAPLNPRQFFHGSPEEFAPGDKILPPAQTGKAMTRVDSHPDHVYVANNPITASQYTWKFKPGFTNELESGQDEHPAGHVYEVQPVGQLRHDPNLPQMYRSMGLSKYTKKHAVVVRKLEPREWR